MSNQLPITLSSARLATRWLMTHFGDRITTATAGTPFSPALLCGMVCQETAYVWLKWVTQPGSTITPDEVVARCVLDASGDYPGTSRNAFPRNTAAFFAKYDEPFGNLLVAEANQTRALRGYGPKPWIYKGYGIFQYDLQAVEDDEAFFRFRQWHDFDICLARALKELKAKYKTSDGSLWEAVRKYNGSGPNAAQYRKNVKEFTSACQQEIDAMAAPAPRAAPKAAPKAAAKSAPTLNLDPGPVLMHQPAAAAPAGARRGLTRGGEKPSAKPRLARAELLEKIASFGIDRAKYPLIAVGIRAYYRDTMGLPGVNDRGMYDDAIFLDCEDSFASFNGNTDPSAYRPGVGFAEGKKGMAVLNPGAWFVHRFDVHNGKYLALCQRAGKVTVTRDGKDGRNYEDTGNFGINIHKGSYHGTSSLGCQTIHPDQWPGFINLATDLARRYHGDNWKKAVIPYVLLAGA